MGGEWVNKSSQLPCLMGRILFKKKTSLNVPQYVLKTPPTPLEARTSSVSSSLWFAWISNGFPTLQYCSNKVSVFEDVEAGCLLGETDGERDCSMNLNS